MKDISIEKFGTKLMASSRSVNKIPEEYMTLALNARIYDGGIGPRKGKQSIIESVIGTNNKGAFLINGVLYQITNSKIYKIDRELLTQTEIVDLGYDEYTDILVYSFPKGDFTSSATESHNFTVLFDDASRITYDQTNNRLRVTSTTGNVLADISLTYDNTGEVLGAVKIVTATTDFSFSKGTGFEDTDGVILTDGQYIEVLLVEDSSNTVGVEVGAYTAEEKAIIASNDRDLQVFDGDTLSTVSVSNSGIIEYCRGYSFLADGNILRISAPITIANPENAYDFTGTDAQQLIYDTNITGLKSTMNGLYIFTKDKVEYIGPDGLQSIGTTPVFTSYALGVGGEPINNQCIAASGDKIFYITKNLQVRTINYLSGTADPSIGELSSRAVVSIQEFMSLVNEEQPSSFAFFNQNDNTIHFHIRTNGITYNNKCLVYDMINDTWAIDIGKYYNYVVQDGFNYYGFSDINSNIYLDDTGYTDAGQSIGFKIVTQNMSQGSTMQKRYGGLFSSGSIGFASKLDYNVNVDGYSVFTDSVEGNSNSIQGLGEIGGDAIGEQSIGGNNNYTSIVQNFDRWADEGRIDRAGTRIQIVISSESQIQDFLIDILGIRAESNNDIDISNKW